MGGSILTERLREGPAPGHNRCAGELQTAWHSRRQSGGLLATATGYGEVQSLPISNVADGLVVADITLTDGVTLEGTVRLATTGQPVAGALVRGYWSGELVLRPRTSNGHYILRDFDRRSISTSHEVLATFKTGDIEWLGRSHIGNNLAPGDHLREIDIAMDVSLETRLAIWKSKPALAPVPGPVTFVLDDADPDFRNKAEYHDTLTAYKGDKMLWQMKVLNVGRMGNSQIIASDPRDGSIWACDQFGSRHSPHQGGRHAGHCIAEIYALAIAVDPETSNLWASPGDARRPIQIFNFTGN